MLNAVLGLYHNISGENAVQFLEFEFSITAYLQPKLNEAPDCYLKISGLNTLQFLKFAFTSTAF